MANLIALLVFTLSLALGQILFKKTAMAMRGRHLIEDLLAVAGEPIFYCALALYGVVTLLWIWILSRVPLSQAYPFVAAGVVLVPLSGIWLFGEKVSPAFWLGAALVAVGIVLTQYGVETR